MDRDLKLALGKLLGETYRVQRKLDMPSASRGVVFALINGIEDVIDRELRGVGLDLSPDRLVSKEKVKAVAEVLDAIYIDEERRAAFTGFYEIEADLSARGVGRGDAMQVLTYFKAQGMFEELFAKMDSDGSPIECRTFELDESEV